MNWTVKLPSALLAGSIEAAAFMLTCGHCRVVSNGGPEMVMLAAGCPAG
jgi:hypothetical protein